MILSEDVTMADKMENDVRDEDSLLTSSAMTYPRNDILLIRILGNDLPPRHGKDQTIRNVEFILRNEAPLSPRLRKKWILNRLVDLRLQETLLEMITAYGQEVLTIPFDRAAFSALQPDFAHFTPEDFGPLLGGQILDDYKYTLLLDHAFDAQNRYVMNVNGARNAAVNDGCSFGWIMPWDGNCFLHAKGWQQILEAIEGNGNEKYLVVPMERVLNNNDLLDPDYSCEALEEPQIIFRADSLERFDEELRYGRYSKVELLRRISYPGVWDGWDYQKWECKHWVLSTDAGRWEKVGWVVRLSSGRDEFDADPSLQGIRRRSNARRISVRNFLTSVCGKFARDAHSDGRGIFFRLDQVLAETNRRSDSGVVESIVGRASQAMQRQLMMVLDKHQVPPSGDKRDYYSVAPFWWPNTTPDGLPYIRRDGERIPEASLDHKESLSFDSTRLQHVFDDVTALALAAVITGETEFQQRAEDIIASWFLGDTGMHPNLRFAQVRRGHDLSEAVGHGIIDAKDIYYFLDAVTLLRRQGNLSDTVWNGLQNWCWKYLLWLKNSPQGRAEARASNNHGTCYELQMLALGCFVGNFDEVGDAFVRSRARLFQQFSCDGAQPSEDVRRTPLHYRLFNIQCWLLLDIMFANLNLILIGEFEPFQLAFDMVINESNAVAKSVTELGVTVSPALMPRVQPIFVMGESRRGQVKSGYLASSLLHPYCGVPPFWQLSLKLK